MSAKFSFRMDTLLFWSPASPLWFPVYFWDTESIRPKMDRSIRLSTKRLPVYLGREAAVELLLEVASSHIGVLLSVPTTSHFPSSLLPTYLGRPQKTYLSSLPPHWGTWIFLSSAQSSPSWCQHGRRGINWEMWNTEDMCSRSLSLARPLSLPSFPISLPFHLSNIEINVLNTQREIKTSKGKG